MTNSGVIGLMGLGTVLGARHAVDWDHIAAISDFVGVEEEKRKGFSLSFNYILGHDTVNILVGILAIFLGHSLPKWIDGVMERIVGTTLFILGIWLLFALFQNRNNQILVSRWKLLYEGLHKIGHKLTAKISGNINSKEDSTSKNIGWKGAYLIGILHGFGGETATQVLIYAAAAGAGTLILGLTALFSFIAGLLIAQLLLIILILMGYNQVAKNRKIYMCIAFLTASYSIVMGVIFLAGRSDALPAITSIFGG